MRRDQPLVLHRTAARVILVDEDDHVLMIHGFDPRSPHITYWYSLGGGLDEGEEPVAAAVGGGGGGVGGETGLLLDRADLVGPLREERVVFPFDGREIHQDQLYFAARTRRFDPAPAAFEELEVRSTVTIDWLDPRALHGVPDTVYPAFLTELVDALVAPEGAPRAATSQNWLSKACLLTMFATSSISASQRSNSGRSG